MLERPLAPDVVGELVVVDDPDDRVGVVHRHQVRVLVVVGVAGAVVLQIDAFVVGRVGTPDVGPDGLRRGRAVGDLVDVVTEMQDEVQVVPLRDAPVPVEEPGRVLRARHHRDPEVVGTAGREGSGTGDRRAFPEGLERVVVRGAGAEPVDLGVDGPIRVRFGDLGSRGDHVRQLGVGRHRPRHR